MGNSIDGIVESVNNSGDLVTDIAVEQLATVPRDESVTVSVGGHNTVGIHPMDHGEPESTMVAVMGQTGFLEIGIVGMRISEMLGIDRGEPVKISW